MLAADRLTQTLLLQELSFLKMIQPKRTRTEVFLLVEKKKTPEVCPRCATLCHSGYDSRLVRVKDSPIRDRRITLIIRKRRLYCKTCKKPFTEPVRGILPRRRTTQRYRSDLRWACENFSDLKKVKQVFRCSNDFLYRSLYESLERKRRTRLYPWPSMIGLDEHAFGRKNRSTSFVTMVVDHKNKRLMEVTQGKSIAELKAALCSIPGRENVKEVTCDLSDGYKSFAKEFFPNCQIIADKFHVLRLLTPAINRRRKEVTGDRRTLKIRRLLLRNRKTLDYFQKLEVDRWLSHHPSLEELYYFKEKLHSLYRIKGFDRATEAYYFLLDEMARSKLKEIKTLRKTLMRWKNEVLCYFKKRLTNARVEGYNNVAKVIKRRSYGFRSFNHYRLRLLNACA